MTTFISQRVKALTIVNFICYVIRKSLFLKLEDIKHVIVFEDTFSFVVKSNDSCHQS